ncbi:FHA domain-containing protein [Alloscardovia theropitheci]|uniref:FHA domain-containing protein n=1 Tax=Alloscardovia theropitheci TaxID=2496842 RepID=A0A4R0QUD0_9BIFI|nr:FHA domain-containing protein [Alloscardovia theropitheci]TCD55005.1 FHA domain-containing protein [Alloscardovia theropitheci]
MIAMKWIKRLLGIGNKLSPIRSASLVSPQLLDIPPLTRHASRDNLEAIEVLSDEQHEAMRKREREKEESHTPVSSKLRARITISDGQSYVLNGACLVGRMPSHSDKYSQIVIVNDPTGQVSREHFACGMDDFGRIWVEDLGSANGTWLRTPMGDKPLSVRSRQIIAQGTMIAFSSFTAQFDYVNVNGNEA